MTVEPHQLEKGNITAHSGHWKQENTFLAKLWRYILGGLETRKFEYHPFKDMQLLVASITSRMVKSATDNFGLAWKMWHPRVWNSPKTLSNGCHSFPCLNFEPWPGHVHMHFLQTAAQKHDSLEKHVWPLPCWPQWFLHLWSYFVQAWWMFPLFLLPLEGSGSGYSHLAMNTMIHQYSKLYY